MCLQYIHIFYMKNILSLHSSEMIRLVIACSKCMVLKLTHYTRLSSVKLITMYHEACIAREHRRYSCTCITQLRDIGKFVFSDDLHGPTCHQDYNNSIDSGKTYI